MQDVRIIGFRGVADNLQYVHEHDLIKAGHVGVSLDGGHTIFGFHPTPTAVQQFASHAMFIQHLRARRPVDGGVYDDTAIFWRAHTLS